MSYDIDSIEFDQISRARDIATAMGKVVSDKLSVLTIPANPYSPDIATSGIPTTYTLELSVTENITGIETTETVSFTSSGIEDWNTVIDSIVADGNTKPTLVMASNLEYTEDEDKYFTVTSKTGFRFSQAPVLVNVGISTDLVQAPTDQPASYLAYGSQPTCGFPRMVITPITSSTSVSPRYNKGVVELDIGDGLKFYPYEEAYITFDVRVTVESGESDRVLSGEVPSPPYIINRLQRKLGQDNHREAFVSEVNATFTYGSPIPTMIVGTEYTDIASCTFTFNLVDRYIEFEGGTMEKVELNNRLLKHTEDGPVVIRIGDDLVDRNE